MEFGYKIWNAIRWVSLCEDINRLFGKREGVQLEITFLEMLTSDVTINFNVLGAFTEDIIISNVNITMIIPIKRSSSGLQIIQVNQKPLKPDELSSGVSKGTILTLSVGTRNNILLLATP